MAESVPIVFQNWCSIKAWDFGYRQNDRKVKMWKDYWKDYVPQGFGAIASFAASGFWFSSALVKIPNDQDGFIAALKSASQLSSYAAIAAGFAALAGLFIFIREWHPRL